ncbi:glycosyltransferase family 4 protein [Streptomyces sp. NPDC056948]|uniref:glycosyltransferase family 4 protein n=1 Tax=Streptomyces sp. NPDC056948 TaxID=3345975 RepID=UPI00363B4CF5
MTSALRITTGIDLPLKPSCGSMIFCSDLYRQMAGRAHTTFLALPPADPAWQHGFAATLFASAAKAPYGPGFERYVEELTSEVQQHLAAHPADVVHAQHLGFGLALAFVRAAQVPVIAIAHGTDVIAATDSPQARAVLTEIVDGATTVVAPNQSLARRINHLTDNQYTDKITLVPWGIPLAAAHRPPRPPSGHRLRLLHAGRLDANKHTITAIEALALTADRHELTVIGSGPELATLQDRARELGVTDQVTFIPFQPREQLWRSFGDFDAFVFTTAGLEAFGLVAVEAQAHGLPVLYAEIAGMASTLGSAALRFPVGDAEQLARTIDRLADNPSLRRRLSNTGPANAARYDIAHSADRLAELTHAAARATA